MDYQIVKVSPEQLRFTQDSIAEYFNYPRGKKFFLEDAFRDLQNGQLKASDFPEIAVASDENGVMWSNDNRRLWLFRKIGISKIKVKYYSRQLYRAPPERHLRDLMGTKDYFPRVRWRYSRSRSFHRTSLSDRNSLPCVSYATLHGYMPREIMARSSTVGKAAMQRRPTATEEAEPIADPGRDRAFEKRVKIAPEAGYAPPSERKASELTAAEYYTRLLRSIPNISTPSEMSRSSDAKASPTEICRSPSATEEIKPLAVSGGEKVYENPGVKIAPSSPSKWNATEIMASNDYMSKSGQMRKSYRAEVSPTTMEGNPFATEEAGTLALFYGDNVYEKAKAVQKNAHLPFTVGEEHRPVPVPVSFKAEKESEDLTPYEEQQRDAPLSLSDEKKVISSQEEDVEQARVESTTKTSETLGAGDIGIADVVVIALLPVVLPVAAIVWGVRKMFGKKGN